MLNETKICPEGLKAIPLIAGFFGVASNFFLAAYLAKALSLSAIFTPLKDEVDELTPPLPEPYAELELALSPPS